MKFQKQIFYRFCYNVLFLGSNNDKISQNFLQGLIKAPKIKDLKVLSTSDRAKQNSLEYLCQSNNIQIFQPFTKDIKGSWKKISDILPSFDLAFICSFGFMVPGTFIDKINKGFFVVHPSLLPLYRGASPIQYSLLNDDKETGISFVAISKKTFDAGKIVIQTKLGIQSDDTYMTLSEKLVNQAVEVIPNMLNNLEYYIENSYEQDQSKITFAPKFSLEDTFLDFENMKAHQIYNKYRAFYGTNFSSIRCKFQDQIVTFNKIDMVHLYNLG